MSAIFSSAILNAHGAAREGLALARFAVMPCEQLTLAEGSVDAVIGQPFVMRHYAAEHPRKPQLVGLDWAPQGAVIPAGLVLSRSQFGEAELGYWRGLVHELVRDGSMARILRRHVSEQDAAEMLPPD